jgi:hypothetical protein
MIIGFQLSDKGDPSGMSISRVDHAPKNTYGYYVRVQRRGVLHAKFFSDLAAGGKRKALRLAREHEAALIEELDANAKPRRSRPGIRNTSGVVGVSRTVMKNGAQEAAYWQANWKDADGTRRGAKFSIAIFGEDEAFRLAVNKRRAGVTALNRALAGRK